MKLAHVLAFALAAVAGLEANAQDAEPVTVLRDCGLFSQVCAVPAGRGGGCARLKYKAEPCKSNSKNRDDVAVEVYSSRQVDIYQASLNEKNEQLNNEQQRLQSEQEELRTHIERVVVTALESLPSQLFSREIQDRLQDELTKMLEARLTEMRSEMKEEIKAELLPELMASMRPAPARDDNP